MISVHDSDTVISVPVSVRPEKSVLLDIVDKGENFFFSILLPKIKSSDIHLSY